ncbi:unnamed protein product [Prorocentrum cordatum]|uniref:Uncharacterized protein n=1 Tax=Prorocentrum cordatum TaxID=2364126 RepID=A0ABN9XS37_9DINO|nr:unnamed protein product [Polarella glacialis]
MAQFSPGNFVASRQRDFVVFMVGACGLLACCLVVLVGLLRGRRLCEGSLLASGATCGRRARQDGACEASLCEELERRRLTRALRILPWAQALVFTNFFVFTVRSGLDGGSVKRFGSIVQDIALSVFSGMISIMWASQWAQVFVVTARSLDYWFSALMACLVVYLSPYAIRADLVAYRMSMIYILSLFLCLWNLKPIVNIPWLFVLCVSSTYTLMFGENAEEIQSDEYSFEQILSDGFQNMILLVGMIIVFHHLLTYIVRLELQSKLSRQELRAATSVLGCVCEVVVDLDAEFRLQRHSRELADMLFLNPQRSLKQEDIRSFLVSESDNSKFTEQMGQLRDCGKEHSDLSKTFQVLMKDSTGMPVNVHVFAVSYFCQGGLMAFKVGVLEVSDSDSMLLPNLGRLAEIRQLRRRGGRPKQDLQGTPPRPPPGPPEDAEDSGGSSNGSSSSVGDLGALDLEQSLGSDPSGSTFFNDFEGGAPAFWFDVLSAGYDILCFSDSFQHCFGTCEDAKFLSWVKMNQHDQFVAWVQEAYVALLGQTKGDISTSTEILSQTLHFMPTHLRQRQLAFSATVFMDLADIPDQSKRGRGTARMTFSSVQRWTSSGARRRPGRGPRRPPQPDGESHRSGGTLGALEAAGLRRPASL